MSQLETWLDVNATTVVALVVAACWIGYLVTGGKHPSDTEGSAEDVTRETLNPGLQTLINERIKKHSKPGNDF